MNGPDRQRGRPRRRPSGGIGGAPAAQSALTLRLLLASFGFVACVACAVLFAVLGEPAGAVVLGLLALVAVVDITVVQRRRHHR